jgi:hypothetical protein
MRLTMLQTWESWLLAACDPQASGLPPQNQIAAGRLLATLEAAQGHGVLGSALQSFKAWSVAPDVDCNNALKTFADRHRKDIGRTLGLRQLAEQVVHSLTADNVCCTILKGQDFASRLYPTPALRPFRDVDILVPRSRYKQADAVVQQLGFKPVEPERKYATDDYGQISYLATSAEQWSLELHWNVINSPAQRRTCSITWDDFAFEPQQLPAQTGAYRRLTPVSLLILAGVHACVGHRFDSLQQLCDIRQICRGAAGAVDAAALAEACQRLRCETPVAWSLDMASRLFDCPEAQALGRAFRFSRNVVRPLALLGRQTVLQPQTRASKLRRSLARLRLKNAA